MMVLYNSSACMPISYLLKREYLHSQATSRLAREACFSLTVSALLSLLSQVPLLPVGREPAACMSLCQNHWLLWGHTAEETTPPEALNCSCLSLWPKRRLLTHHWRALTPMEAKSGPALCILVAGSTGKIGFFFFSFISGQRETTWLLCNIRKTHEQNAVVKGPDSKWVVRLTERLCAEAVGGYRTTSDYGLGVSQRYRSKDENKFLLVIFLVIPTALRAEAAFRARQGPHKEIYFIGELENDFGQVTSHLGQVWSGEGMSRGQRMTRDLAVNAAYWLRAGTACHTFQTVRLGSAPLTSPSVPAMS